MKNVGSHIMRIHMLVYGCIYIKCWELKNEVSYFLLSYKMKWLA